MNLDALVAPLRADVVSGAAVVARAAAAAMRRGAVQLPAQDPAQLRTALERLAVEVLNAQPSMASLVGLLTGVLAAVDDADSVEEARRASARATEEFRRRLEQSGEEVAAVLARKIPAKATILTISSSTTVRSGLVQAREKYPTVMVLEGRPMTEGQSLARTLAESGVSVLLAVDAAAESLVSRADLVLLGADSVGDDGVVNKIGSTSLARAAVAHSVPVWVATDRTKWLPPGFPQVVADDRPAEEVWRGGRGVRVWNRYFEILPYDLVDRILTEDGSQTPDELTRARQALRVAPALMAWADSYTD